MRFEIDHEYKYRFLAMQENGDVSPIYNPGQTIPGGGGDLILTFNGFPGSGFEFCDTTT